MLNKKGERELAYVVKIDDVTPIEGYDWVELAHVSGWTIVVEKGEFKHGDPAIYFEIDSKLPEVKPFTDMGFLAKKHYKIKTQKMCRSISQGLLMSAANFGWSIGEKIELDSTSHIGIWDNEGEFHAIDEESRFLTTKLGVTYAEPDDNQRKAASVDKYKTMAQRHGKLFSHQPYRWLMKRNWGKKLLFLFYGRKKDGKNGWPAWVKKTDEERVQNMPWIIKDPCTWIATEKIDGTSTTFTIRKKHHKFDFLVCSRNVVFNKPNKKCFYDSNVYIEMAEKYDIEKKMKEMFDYDEFKNCEWITIQGETYGAGIQKRDYSINEHDFKAFNLITSKKGRYGTKEMRKILQIIFNIPCVPIIDYDYKMPNTVEELLKDATGLSKIDAKMREGIVFRSEDGTKSFKAVSNEYLLKFHQ